MIYHFEKYNIPLDRDLVIWACHRIDVPDRVYVIRDHRIGTVVDVDSQGIFTVECRNRDVSEGSLEEYSLYSGLCRNDLRLLEIFHKRVWGKEFD